MTVQAVYDEVLRASLAAVPKSKSYIPKPVPDLEQPTTNPLEYAILGGLTPVGRKWAKKLVRVLESRHEVAIRAIAENLIAFKMLACGTDAADPAAGNAIESAKAFGKRIEGLFDRAETS